MLDYNWSINYKSTNTIYENEYLLIADEGEFNVSTNPTSVIYDETGVGRIKPIFANYEYSASIDPTGSFATPYVTTIGLYDDNMDLVAVAKLPQPIKSEHDITVNFIVRFDT